MIRIYVLSLLLGFLSWLPGGYYFDWIDHPRIISPRSGDVLQGVVAVTGSTNVSDFKMSEVSFSYDRQGEDSAWFAIQRSQEPVKNQTLANWDTTTITDGLYRLRVQVTLTNGKVVETVVDGLKVRNYSAVETTVPKYRATSVISTPDKVALQTPTEKINPTSTRMPSNPAEVTPSRFMDSILQGSSFAVIAFLAFGIYLAVRSFTGRSRR